LAANNGHPANLFHPTSVWNFREGLLKYDKFYFGGHNVVPLDL
jgi:hypothetical protein